MSMGEAKVDVFCDPKRQLAAGFPVLTVPLSSDMMEQAEEFARVLEQNLPSVSNYTGIEATNRYRDGFLAEFAFANVLKHVERAFIYAPRIDGKSDGGSDFRVSVFGVIHSVDVKTASRSHHQYLMIPDAMWSKHGCSSDYYVGSRLDLDAGVCEVWGVALYLELATVSIRVPNDDRQPKVLAPTRAIPLTDLHTMESFVTHLDAGPAQITLPS
jgi:hypothetical protein